MNGKTARMLRRYSLTPEALGYDSLKRVWNRIPRPERNGLRRRAIGKIARWAERFE